MKQTNHKHTASSGSLTSVLQKHSLSVNSSNPELVLQGVALNSPKEVLSTEHEKTQDKNDNQNRISLKSYNYFKGRIPVGHRDNQGTSSLESTSELKSLEIKMQTSVLPAVFHNRLSSRDNEEQNGHRVCELYPEDELFKRHLNLAALRKQERGNADKILKSINLRLLSADKESEKYFKKEVAKEFSGHSFSEQKSPVKRKDKRNTRISTKNGKKALQCSLSRTKASNSPINQDLDYQYYDLRDLDAFDIDGNLDNVIDVVARENSDACGTIFPPLSANKCRLKHRYVSEFNGTPSTPLLREYTRISNCRLTEFQIDPDL